MCLYVNYYNYIIVTYFLMGSTVCKKDSTGNVIWKKTVTIFKATLTIICRNIYIMQLLNNSFAVGELKFVKARVSTIRRHRVGVSGFKARQEVASPSSERTFFPAPEYQCHIIMCDLDFRTLYNRQHPPLRSHSVLITPITF